MASEGNETQAARLEGGSAPGGRAHLTPRPVGILQGMARYWKEALERQAELQRIQRERTGARPGMLELELAAKVELAEAAQRIKARWAWWRRNDKRFEVDREGFVEELADVLHFVLAGLLLTEARFRVGDLPVGAGRRNGRANGTVSNFVGVFRESSFEALFHHLLGLALSEGVGEEEFFEAYMRKSAVNLERWR